MNFKVFAKALKAWRARLIIFALAMALFEVLIAAVYPSFGKLLIELPGALKAFLKMQSGVVPGQAMQGFLAFGYFHPLWLIISAAFAISVGAGAVAGEIERKTILVLLSRPLPRYQLITSRGLLTVLGAAVLMLASVAGTALGVWIIATGEPFEVERFLWVAFNGFALLLAIAGYAFLFSSLSTSGGQAGFMAAGLTLIFFLLDFLTDIWETIEPLAPFSLFYYYDPGSIVRNGVAPWHHLALLLGVTALSFIASLAIFQRRNIST